MTLKINISNTTNGIDDAACYQTLILLYQKMYNPKLNPRDSKEILRNMKRQDEMSIIKTTSCSFRPTHLVTSENFWNFPISSGESLMHPLHNLEHALLTTAYRISSTARDVKNIKVVKFIFPCFRKPLALKPAEVPTQYHPSSM